MRVEFERFWIARSIGRLAESQELLEQIEKGLGEDVKGEDRAELALARNSLVRTRQGGVAAQNAFQEFENDGVFNGHKRFSYHYQRALNAFAQGLYSESLEWLLMAQNHCRNSWEKLSCLTTRLICLDNLNFPTESAWSDIESILPSCEVKELRNIVELILKGVHSRELFRQGQFVELVDAFEGNEWMQLSYFCSWVAALPFAQVKKDGIAQSLQRLTKDADFYLRNYRLQTLIGRLQQGPQKIPTTWGDRVERLYLWTWRWLADPSSHHAHALTSVLADFEDWNGLDVLTADEMSMTRNALFWILIYEPSLRTRFAGLLRRVQGTVSRESALFSYEALWIERTQAALQKDESGVALADRRLNAHVLHHTSDVNFREWGNKLTSVNPVPVRILVDPESGEIRKDGERVVLSAPLARLIALLVSQKVSFATALETGFEISPFDPVIHDAKVQNLVARARSLLEGIAEIKTKNRWILLDVAPDQIQVATLSSFRRLHLPPREERTPPAERVRNERSLSVLLKEAAQFRGRAFNRAELEKVLQIPKPTLNRYLKVWLERGWLQKNGNGPKTVYRITFFDS